MTRAALILCILLAGCTTQPAPSFPPQTPGAAVDPTVYRPTQPVRYETPRE